MSGVWTNVLQTWWLWLDIKSSTEHSITFPRLRKTRRTSKQWECCWRVCARCREDELNKQSELGKQRASNAQRHRAARCQLPADAREAATTNSLCARCFLEAGVLLLWCLLAAARCITSNNWSGMWIEPIIQMRLSKMKRYSLIISRVISKSVKSSFSSILFGFWIRCLPSSRQCHITSCFASSPQCSRFPMFAWNEECALRPSVPKSETWSHPLLLPRLLVSPAVWFRWIYLVYFLNCKRTNDELESGQMTGLNGVVSSTQWLIRLQAFLLCVASPSFISFPTLILNSGQSKSYSILFTVIHKYISVLYVGLK